MANFREMFRPQFGDMFRDQFDGGGSTRLVYDFDGIDDYIAIPTVNLVAGDIVTLKFIAPTSRVPTDYAYLVDNNLSTDRFGIAFNNSSNTWYGNGAYTFTVDGVPTVLGDAIPLDGEGHIIVCTLSQSLSMGVVGCRYSISLFYDLAIYDLDIQAVSGNRFYPINDGFAANPVIANTLDAFPELWLNPVYVTTGIEPNFSIIDTETGLIAGELVEYVVVVTGLTSGSLNLVLGSTSIPFFADGTYTNLVTPSSTQFLTQVGSPPNAGATLDVSVKQTTAGEAMNFNAERWINV